MHQLGSPGQQLRLKRSMMRQNWKNLSVDFQEVQSVSEDPAPLTLQPQEELEVLMGPRIVLVIVSVSPSFRVSLTLFYC